MDNHYLTTLFNPRSVAVFGASDRDDAVGALTFRNIVSSGFEGAVYPINPKRDRVQGRVAYPSLEAVGKPVDLAVIATPAAAVPAVMDDCGRHGTRAAVVLTAGFREVGASGLRLERSVVDQASEHGIRFIGPNCLGIMRPSIGLNATFGNSDARPGHLALVSQSGALCTAILDWADGKQVGFSSVISTGISADLDFGEVLDFLIADPLTESILLYIEGIRDARSFMSGLRAAARVKPIIVMKSGRHAAGSRAAVSHTGAMVGADDVFDAALKRAGVLRVIQFSDLFSAARTLSTGLSTRGSRLAIVTNGGGPGIMATDRMADHRLQLATLADQTRAALDAVLPATWSHANPIDIIGDAPPERYREAISTCLAAAEIDAVLTILTPQAMTRPEAVATEVVALAKESGKPILACWMGGAQVASSRVLFNAHGIPSFQTPEAAVDAFHFLASHEHNQRLLLQVPEPLEFGSEADVEGARMIVDAALADGRKVLNEMESKALLSAFRIPVAKSMLARNSNEALLIAEEIGFPVVLKINSPDITHKSDVDGVRLNITTAPALRKAYDEIVTTVRRRAPEARIDGVVIEQMCLRKAGRELMIGVISDPVFGPVISFGMGGTAVEVLADRAIALPPLNHYLVSELVASTRASKLLAAFRNLPPANLEELERLLMRISEMVCELPQLKEMDINPLIVDDQGAIAVDARMVIARPSMTRRDYEHMAIHPYPTRLVSEHLLADGNLLTVRPIRPEDARIEHRFVHELSSQAKYFRFMHALQDLTPQMLSRLTQIDYDREMALIAVIKQGDDEIEIGVARYIINPDGQSCEFAIVVADEWQGKGVATRLMTILMQTAREMRIQLMEGTVLRENHNMLKLMERLGFSMRPSTEDSQLTEVRQRL